MRDVEESDYFYLLHLFSETKVDDNERMSGEDFFRSIGRPTK